MFLVSHKAVLSTDRGQHPHPKPPWWAGTAMVYPRSNFLRRLEDRACSGKSWIGELAHSRSGDSKRGREEQ
eukprot:1586284-Pleurochrysis_carterae.AAC.1